MLGEEEEPLVDALRIAVRPERGVIAEDSVGRQSTGWLEAFRPSASALAKSSRVKTGWAEKKSRGFT